MRQVAAAIMNSYKYMVCTLKSVPCKPPTCGCRYLYTSACATAYTLGYTSEAHPPPPHPPLLGGRKYLSEAKQKEIAAMALQPNGDPFSKSLAECELILRELKHVDSTSQEKQI